MDEKQLMGSNNPEYGVFVLGMHRSGTSAMTRVLNLLGLSLPGNLMPPVPGNNETGFWESSSLKEIHDSILQQANRTWDDPRPVAESFFSGAYAAIAEGQINDFFKSEFADQCGFVLKDPRSCLLFPFWRKVMSRENVQTKCVLIFRNPNEVILSLQKRDGFSFQKAGLLWLDHVLAAERYSRGLTRIFVAYEDLLADWKGTLNKIGSSLKIPFSDWEGAQDAVSQFLSKKYWHQRANSPGPEDPKTEWLIFQVYQVLQELKLNPENEDICRRLDEMYQHYRAATAFLFSSGPPLAFEDTASKNATTAPGGDAVLDNLAEHLEATQTAQINLLSALPHLPRLETELKNLAETVAESKKQLNDLEVAQKDLFLTLPDVGEMKSQLSKLVEQVATSKQQLNHLENLTQTQSIENAELKHDYLTLSQQFSLQNEQISQLNASFAATNQKFRREFKKLKKKGRKYKQKATFFESENQTLHERLDQAYQERERLKTDLATANGMITNIGDQLGRMNREEVPQDFPEQPMAQKRVMTYKPSLKQWASISKSIIALGLRVRVRELRNYLRTIWRLKKSPLFDADYYLQMYPDVGQSELDPHQHYALFGYMEGRQPGPLFDPQYYLSKNPDVASAEVNPLIHFLQFGASEGRSPHCLFDVQWYTHQYPEAKSYVRGPFFHYLEVGVDKNHWPHPLFDPEWYRSRLPKHVRVQPLQHYLAEGEELLMDPNPLFNVGWYLDQNPDILRSGQRPLEHFVLFGWREGRFPNAFFDPLWYAAQVAQEVLYRYTPLGHFLHIGWKEGLHPSPKFDCSKYLANNPDVHQANLNPLVHYLHTGCHEGRQIAQISGLSSSKENPTLKARYVSYQPHALTPRIRLFAFYLPQFHPIPENDKWWGKGFTEWTNVTKAQPQFVGHYQPKLPGELGFYDLRLPEIQKRQIELARNYGIEGFCFHFYWFAGKRLLERPLQQLISDPSMNISFFLCWANENWTRVWDGHDRDVLMAQKHSAEDDLAFIRYVGEIMKDPRYVRFGDRPVLVVYRPSLLPNAKKTAKRWREYIREAGLGELFLMCVQFDVDDPRTFGFDAAVEFPPHKLARNLKPINEKFSLINPQFSGLVLPYDAMAKRARAIEGCEYPLIRGVCPAWDNEARRPGRGTIYQGSSPQKYQQWLEQAMDFAEKNPVENQRVVMINAWNEWAEGAYLEPDQALGYAYLEATGQAQLQFQNQRPSSQNTGVVLVTHDCYNHGAQQNALHMARTLKQDFGLNLKIVVANDGGPLLDAFSSIAPTFDFFSQSSSSYQQQQLLQEWRTTGFECVLCNTTVSGHLVPLFKQAGFKVVSLVHELPQLIQNYRLESKVQAIADYADYVVFAAPMVKSGFLALAPQAQNKAVIMPQGLYKKVNVQKIAARASIKADIYQRFNIPAHGRLVLNVGYADERKGFDIFIRTAISVGKHHSDIYFLWLGCEEPSLLSWAKKILAEHQLSNRVVLLPRDAQVADFYLAADLFVLTSREDPFPSVVLEAMSYGLPVLAFEGATGCAELIQQNCGETIPNLDEDALAQQIPRVFEDVKRYRQWAQEGPRRIQQDFGWEDYLQNLLKMAQKPALTVSVIVPNYNYAQYLPERLKSIFDQTYLPFEVVVLDDCSTDESLSVLQALQQKNGYDFRIIQNERNSGSVFKQWLKGLQAVKGDLVWIAEADDLCAPEFLARLVEKFTDPEMVMAYCESKQIDENGGVLAENYWKYVEDIDGTKWQTSYIRAGREELVESLSVKNTIPNVSAVLFRRSVLHAVLEENFDFIMGFRFAGDYAVYMHVLSKGKMFFDSIAHNSHRRHQNSVTLSNYNEHMILEIIKMQKAVYGIVHVDKKMNRIATGYIQELFEQFGLCTSGTNDWRKYPSFASEAIHPLYGS
ncbi:MAG: glycoside hydrolase family 99-like domain-containing protein [Acidobacteria bacterium]|nr:glycoside hydrolase family 99-like domain-containing protein [Acidobacteriota bacterium]